MKHIINVYLWWCGRIQYKRKKGSALGPAGAMVSKVFVLLIRVMFVLIGVAPDSSIISLCGEYVRVSGSRVFVRLCLSSYYVSIWCLQYCISELSTVISIVEFIESSVLAAIGVIASSMFVIGRIRFSFANYFLDSLRILIIVSMYFSSYYEVRRRGVEFNTIFAFRPIMSRSLAQAGAAFQVPLMLESVLLQLVYIMAQVVWVAFSALCDVSLIGIGIVHTAIFVSAVTITSFYKFWNVYLVGGFGKIGLMSSLVFAISVYCCGNRFRNFSNQQLLFSFVAPNRWFGSNFSPGSTYADIFINVFDVRFRLLGSSFRRLESIILFTSQLRLDPKQVDLPYW